METTSYYKHFEGIIERLLRAFDFTITAHEKRISKKTVSEIDLVVARNGSQTFVEVKFYRSKNVPASSIKNAAEQLRFYVNGEGLAVSGLLIISSYTSKEMKADLRDRYGIIIWDRNDLFNLIKYGLRDTQLLEDFAQLLSEAQQGIDIEDVFADTTFVDAVPGDYFQALQIQLVASAPTPPPPKRDLCRDLKAVFPGKPGWSSYEKVGVEVLRYLFEKDLANWNTQQTTDDDLNRFDMICRVVSKNDFWKNLIQSFQSRYVLFEFKNYSDPIGQGQIYTTERYLYLRGLRSVGFIIAPNGGSPQAHKAAKGALREHGKVIIILSNDDLCKMITMKENGGEPNDYLSDRLDEFLISLSR